MNGYRITYRTLSGMAPEDEVPTLANVYAMLVDRRHGAAVDGGGSNDAEKEIKDEEFGTEASIPEGG